VVEEVVGVLTIFDPFPLTQTYGAPTNLKMPADFQLSPFYFYKDKTRVLRDEEHEEEMIQMCFAKFIKY
jgi:hypothetical protein